MNEQPPPRSRASWILLTMGDRPDDLRAAVASIRSQTVPPHQIVVVGNGADPGEVEGAEVLVVDDNLGVPGGRNLGAGAATGELLCFLDDDAVLADADVTEALVDAFDADPSLAAISMRLVDPRSGRTARRHVPRLRADADRSGAVTSFLGGACAIRSDDFRAAGGFPAEFHYAMEETDLAWRLLDRDRSIRYLADTVVHHPETAPARHGDAFVLTARNRVWLAHRRLPRVLTAVYVAVWAVLMVARAPTWTARREVVVGLVAGVRERTPRPIDRMTWRTVWRMTLLGRPPVI